MMLTLNDGRAELWQWDTGRTLAVDADCSQVHFSNKVFGRSIDVDVVDGAAIIPDVLLQTDKDLNAWAFVGTAENGYTKISKTFKVNRRNKPADYVFTPTDQATLDDILGRIEDLEKRPSGGNGGITKEVDPTVPDWAKQPQKPTYTAADVGSIPVPKTATAGQTVVVKAVGEDGRPTKWEARDSMPATGVEDAGKVLTVTDSGIPGWMQPSQGDWKTLVDVTTEEDASAFQFTFDDVSELIIMISGTATSQRINFFSDGITNFYHYKFLIASEESSNYLHIHKRIGGMRYMESGDASLDTPETGFSYALIHSQSYGIIVRSVKDSINDLRFNLNTSYILQSGARIQIFGR